jgi:TolA-binding protein
VCLRAGNNIRAGELFEKSLNFFKEYLNSQENVVIFTHVDYNLGNCFMAKKEHAMAAENYVNVLQRSPLARVKSDSTAQGEESDQKLHFNSQSCYAHTWSNLAVIFLLASINEAVGLPDSCPDQAVKAA